MLSVCSVYTQRIYLAHLPCPKNKGTVPRFRSGVQDFCASVKPRALRWWFASFSMPGCLSVARKANESKARKLERTTDQPIKSESSSVNYNFVAKLRTFLLSFPFCLLAFMKHYTLKKNTFLYASRELWNTPLPPPPLLQVDKRNSKTPRFLFLNTTLTLKFETSQKKVIWNQCYYQR